MTRFSSAGSVAIGLFAITLCATPRVSDAEVVTLVARNNVDASFRCKTNQVVTVLSFVTRTTGNGGSATIMFRNGLSTVLYPYRYGPEDSTSPIAFNGGTAVFTGVTNIHVTSTSTYAAALTFSTTDQNTAASTVPANTVVIPTDAKGPVQIVLESSADLVNWTSAEPGTYGSTYPNRFFRVRAIAQ